MTTVGLGTILKHMVKYRAAADDGTDAVFRALADPTRRAIVERLCTRPASVSELARPLAMSLPAVVQHLEILESSGLVRSEKVGRVRTCRVDPRALDGVDRWISDRRTTWARRLDRLGDLFANEPPTKGARP